jgi:hypothetical protein
VDCRLRRIKYKYWLRGLTAARWRRTRDRLWIEETFAARTKLANHETRNLRDCILLEEISLLSVGSEEIDRKVRSLSNSVVTTRSRTDRTERALVRNIRRIIIMISFTGAQVATRTLTL